MSSEVNGVNNISGSSSVEINQVSKEFFLDRIAQKI